MTTARLERAEQALAQARIDAGTTWARFTEAVERAAELETRAWQAREAEEAAEEEYRTALAETTV